jgi:hypothetical protein
MKKMKEQEQKGAIWHAATAHNTAPTFLSLPLSLSPLSLLLTIRALATSSVWQ